MSFKCVIIDDEPLAIEVLENYIKRTSNLTLVAKFNNGIDALSYVNSSQVDVLFLDMQMPGLSGMDFLKLVKRKINLVLTSSSPKYALQGYDYNPVDFLLKPIPFEKFMRATSRVQTVRESIKESAPDPSVYFYIKSKGKNVRLLTSDILYIEGIKDYVVFYTSNARYISHHSLKELEGKFPSKQFVRIHKSYMVEIKKVEETGGSQVKVFGKYLPIGRRYKASFLQFIESRKIKMIFMFLLLSSQVEVRILELQKRK